MKTRLKQIKIPIKRQKVITRAIITWKYHRLNKLILIMENHNLWLLLNSTHPTISWCRINRIVRYSYQKYREVIQIVPFLVTFLISPNKIRVKTKSKLLQSNKCLLKHQHKGSQDSLLLDHLLLAKIWLNRQGKSWGKRMQQSSPISLDLPSTHSKIYSRWIQRERRKHDSQVGQPPKI